MNTSTIPELKLESKFESENELETKETEKLREAKQHKIQETTFTQLERIEQQPQEELAQCDEDTNDSRMRVAVLDTLPIVDVSSTSGNLFDSGNASEWKEQIKPSKTSKRKHNNPFTTSEQLLLFQSKQTILMIDVEACDPEYGPVLAIGCVLGVYRDFMKYDIIRRSQWIIQRTRKDCGTNKKVQKFWFEDHLLEWNYFTQHSLNSERYSEEYVANSFRDFLNMLWRYVPHLCIMVDNVHIDLTMINNLFAKYGHKPLHFDGEGTYKYSIYVSRDLLRGSYSLIDSSFSKLEKEGLSKAINDYWKTYIGGTNTKRPQYGGKHHDVLQYGRKEKHYPVWDATMAWTSMIQMEDCRRYHEAKMIEMQQMVNRCFLEHSSEIYYKAVQENKLQHQQQFQNSTFNPQQQQQPILYIPFNLAPSIGSVLQPMNPPVYLPSNASLQPLNLTNLSNLSVVTNHQNHTNLTQPQTYANAMRPTIFPNLSNTFPSNASNVNNNSGHVPMNTYAAITSNTSTEQKQAYPYSLPPQL